MFIPMTRPIERRRLLHFSHFATRCALVAGVLMTACTRQREPSADAAATARHYAPQRREVTVTTVPLLVKEMQATLPFLKQDFAKGGVLDGQEVYGFYPSTLTMYAGDTLVITFVNPEDDEHSFVLPPNLYVKIPGQTATTTATFVAKEPGIFTARCAIPAHSRSMVATVVVLPPPAVAGDAATKN
jgi:plastocyanin